MGSDRFLGFWEPGSGKSRYWESSRFRRFRFKVPKIIALWKYTFVNSTYNFVFWKLSRFKRYAGGALWRARNVGVRFGFVVRMVGYGMEYGIRWYGTYGVYGVRCGTVHWYSMMVQYDGTVVQCIAPTVPLHRTTLVYQKIRCEKCKIGCRRCKINWLWKLGNWLWKLSGIWYACWVQCTPTPYHRTSSVPTAPYHCTHERTYCTVVPTCTVYLTSVPIVSLINIHPSSVRHRPRRNPCVFSCQMRLRWLHFGRKFWCHSRQPRRNRCVFSCYFILTVNLHVTPANPGEIVVFSHVKCAWPSFWLCKFIWPTPADSCVCQWKCALYQNP